MPVTHKAPPPPAAVAKAASAAARARRSRNQMPTLREALPLLLLLLLLGLGGVSSCSLSRAGLEMAELVSRRASGRQTAAKDKAALAEEIINSQAVRDALKGEGWPCLSLPSRTLTWSSSRSRRCR